MTTKQQSKYTRRQKKQLAFAKSQGGWGKAIRPRPNCPTPKKREFNTENSAIAATNGVGTAYSCRCGSWHRTRSE